ncbi:MAG: conjugative transfer signal peptidase TraF [Desulfovibrio sp.]|jgi:conjugative transfer signal peptidase TraF|nr:conjugative transfer signal peptidase TraF [Desulfovibrio sp.]
MKNILMLLSASFIVLAGLYGAGFRINVTASMPPGIYRIFFDETPKRGGYVSFCPDEDAAAVALNAGYLQPGSCMSGVRPLLKILVGVAGDTLRIAPEGVYINEALLPESAVLTKDKNGVALAHKAPEGSIPDGQAFLLANHQGSYDSRYFGFVPASRLMKVVPVYLF